MEHLLRAWPRVAGEAAARRPLVILSDYDGTLTQIAPTPDEARLPAARRALLARLGRARGVRLGFISGRSLRQLKRMVAVPGAVYVGNHGLEAQGCGLSFVHPKARAARPLLRRLAQRLERALQDLPGAWVEWKGLTISVHWRAVPRSAQQAFHRRVRLVTREERARRRIRLTTGKRVVEVRPNVTWGKGESLTWLWRRMRYPRAARPFDSGPGPGPGRGRGPIAQDVAHPEAKGRPASHRGERALRLGSASLRASAEPVEARAKRVEGRWQWSPGLARGAPRTQLVYLGDDRTDEEAFKAVNRLGGLSVLVGRSLTRTSARYWLRDPRDVQAWLTALLEDIQHQWPSGPAIRPLGHWVTRPLENREVTHGMARADH